MSSTTTTSTTSTSKKKSVQKAIQKYISLEDDPNDVCCTRAVLIAFLAFFVCVLIGVLVILGVYAGLSKPVQGPPGPPGPPCNCSFFTNGQYEVESTKQTVKTTVKWTRAGPLIHFTVQPFQFQVTAGCDPIEFSANPFSFEHLPPGNKNVFTYPSYFDDGEWATEMKVVVQGTNSRMIYYPLCNGGRQIKPETKRTSAVFFTWMTK